MDVARQGWRLVVDPAYSRWICYAQLLFEVVFCVLIIEKVPYTNIDWEAYMQQIESYMAGERDYAKIAGNTGPLVYPAAHVYIYRILYSLTASGTSIRSAQYIFMAVYLVTLALAMSCYRAAKVPPYMFPLLSLSKRMHSLFVLRLFNDCFAILFLFAAVWFWQRRFWTYGTLAYSVGLGVKMSLLLALPAIGMVMWQGMGRDRAFYQGQSIGQVQMLLGYPFIAGNLRNYVSKAFEFTRQFLFKWTVNWRFVGEDVFLSRPFSLALLGLHVLLLYTFGLSRWLEPAGLSLPEAIDQLIHPPPKDVQARVARRVTPDFVLTSILTAVIIGCLCARSLHYQFFVYIAWSVPFLLWRSGLHPVLVYAIVLAQEWAWNVYPSTQTSSVVVVGCLAVTVASVWIGTSSYLKKHDESTGEVAEKKEQ